MNRTVEPRLERYHAHRIWVRLETQVLEREGYGHEDALALAEEEADERVPGYIRRRADAAASIAAVVATVSLFALIGFTVAAVLMLDTGMFVFCYAAGVLAIAMTLLFLAIQPVPYLWFMTVEEYREHTAEQAEGQGERDRALPGKHRRKGRA